MKFLQSIRWRLQLWHGLLLVLVLAGFGFTAWRLQRATQLQRIDQELEQRISVLAGGMPRGGGPGGRPPEDRPPRDRPPRDRPPQDRPPWDRPQRPEGPGPDDPPPRPLAERLSPRDLRLFEGTPGNDFYYVVWQSDDQDGSGSVTAPAEVPRPAHGAQARESRLRGTLRERFHFLPPGECVLVGRDIGEELAGMRRFAWLLAGVGLVVLALGLAGGWWVSTLSLRPLGDITATAARIATGDLTQRIPAAKAGSELSALAHVLNDTFARLQASFARQAQFTADASHELRTPLSVVLTQTQVALARERPASEYRESLAACQRAAQRMRRLTESLLALARLDSGEAAASRAPCDLDRIARDATELLRPLAQEQGVTLETELDATRCQGDADQVGQVVTNLVSNAISYNRRGGSVRVKVVAEPEAAVLVVSDTGQGIAPEDLPHLFERFYRGDQARSGAAGSAGLGLAITKAIVEAHGGTIEVATQLGQGSTFTTRWPRAAPPPTSR